MLRRLVDHTDEFGAIGCPTVAVGHVILVDDSHVKLAQLGDGTSIGERAFVTEFLVNKWLRVKQL